jgi:uncharacterized protein
MKWSKYNYLFKSSKYGYLLYNSLSNSFVEIDEDGYEFFQSLQGKENVEMNDKDNLQTLTEIKALVENDKDEYYNIKYLTHLQRFSQHHLELTLNPTLHCNFSCPYCFEQNKPPIYMTDEVENSLIEFVKGKNHVQSIHVVWFGGEPLMAYDRIVSITNRIKALDAKIDYSSSMITNGYLLSEEVINNLEELNISNIQITIDGPAEIHDKRRPLKSGKGTFDTIVQNIDNLKKHDPNYNIVIRVNVDGTNDLTFIDTFRFFHKRYGMNMPIIPGFITNESNCTSIDCVYDREKKAKFLTNLYKQYGLNVFGFYPDEIRYECPIRNPYYLVIGPEGEIYKCWDDVGNKNMVVGSLMDKEMINHSLLTRYYVGGDALDDNNCRDCFHLPICGGGCPHIRIENEYQNKKTDVCDYMKDNLSEFLELHYDCKNKFLNNDEK